MQQSKHKNKQQLFRRTNNKVNTINNFSSKNVAKNGIYTIVCLSQILFLYLPFSSIRYGGSNLASLTGKKCIRKVLVILWRNFLVYTYYWSRRTMFHFIGMG